jgi:beta-glucosidase
VAHGLAVQAFRAAAPSAPPGGRRPAIGIVLNLWPNHAASDHPRDRWANQRFDAISNRFFLEVLFRGTYPAEALRFFSQRFIWPRQLPNDLDLIGQPIDFVGTNTYSRNINQARPLDPLFGVRQVRPRGPTTAMGWEIYPPSVYEALHLLKEYTDLPLFIAESGAAFDDHVLPDGTIDDAHRVAYLQAHLAEAHRAIREGIDLRGYFVWSLLDNFEWEHGYSKRFGLVHVDFASQRRTWKRSAHWYKEVIARNGLVVE